MARVSTIDALYQRQKARFAAVQTSAKQGFRQIAESGRDDLVELTGGHISKETLRRLGHPFGRGASAALSTPTGLGRGAARGKLKVAIGRGRLPYLPINVQSGRLRRGVFLRWRGGGRTTSADVGSGAKHARYIFWPAGTRRMVGRGVMGGRKVGFALAGALEKRWAQRKKAWRERFMRAQRKS